jgi:hypothetical protein
MIKGMFYLVPLLGLNQAATSNPHPQVEARTVLVSTETERVREKPAIATVTATTATNRATTARPTAARPRNGRNNRVFDKHKLVKRN